MGSEGGDERTDHEMTLKSVMVRIVLHSRRLETPQASHVPCLLLQPAPVPISLSSSRLTGVSPRVDGYNVYI